MVGGPSQAGVIRSHNASLLCKSDQYVSRRHFHSTIFRICVTNEEIVSSKRIFASLATAIRD